MTSLTFFIFFIPFLAIVLLAINFAFAPHKPNKDKDSQFECGFSSFTQMSRLPFSISFFIYALLFLLFDLEILLVYPYVVSAYNNSEYGLTVMLVFFILLTIGFVFEIGKKALEIDSRQKRKKTNGDEKHMKNNNIVTLYRTTTSWLYNFIYSMLQELGSLKQVYSKYGIFSTTIMIIVIIIIMFILLITLDPTTVYAGSPNDNTEEEKDKEVIVVESSSESEDAREHRRAIRLGKRKHVETEDEDEDNTNLSLEDKSETKDIVPLEKKRRMEDESNDKSKIIGVKRGLRQGRESVLTKITDDYDKFQADMQEAIRLSKINADKYGESSKASHNAEQGESSRNLDNIGRESTDPVNVENSENEEWSDSDSYYSSLNGDETPETYEKKVKLLQNDEYIKYEQDINKK